MNMINPNKDPSNQHKVSEGRLPVIELFGPTIQGEGRVCGSKSHFIRFGGCDYRCSWCDSMHAVDPDQVKKNAQWYTPKQIIEMVKALPPAPMVSLTGGNPAMWDLTELIHELGDSYVINVETQGSIWAEWFRDCNIITVSPKGPSSGMSNRTDWQLLERFALLNQSAHVEVIFKVVIFNEEDYLFAKDIYNKFDSVPMFLSAGTIRNYIDRLDMHKHIISSLYNLATRVCEDPEMQDAIVLPQMHALIWGSDKGR